MTERQRLITKYITRLSRPTSVRYQLHFLRTERDESARHMLQDSLSQIQKETGNSELQNVINDVKRNSTASIKYGKHEVAKSKLKKMGETQEGFTGKNQKTDHAQRGYTKFSSLSLEDSLKSFNQAIQEYRKTSSHADKFYKQRTEINLVLENYKEALSLAMKGHYRDMAFVAAIASGNFELARDFIPPLCKNIIDNVQEREVIATTYEMIHLILFVCFATATSSETSSIADSLFNSTNFDLQFLKELSDSFCHRNFGHFVKLLPKLNEILNLSIYTSPVSDLLLRSMKSNAIVNTVLPLAKARLDSLKAEIGLPEAEIVLMIRQNIRSRKLNGKLDLVSKLYIGGIVDSEHLEMKDAFSKTLEIRQNFELNLWQQEYNNIQPPPTKKTAK